MGEQSGESAAQVARYIRLTNLVPELLEFVDIGRMKMQPAVELSYLDEESQRDLADIIDDTDIFPSFSQTVRMRNVAHQAFGYPTIPTRSILLINLRCKNV